MIFEITDVDALGRLGKIKVNEKEMITPNLFPVIHPLNNSVSIADLKKIGAECIFTNAYILYQNEIIREKVLKEGIHKYLGFNGIIATDSGAFQQYMYNNHHLSITPATIEMFQERIESDFPVILDIPVQIDDDFHNAKEKVDLNIKRAKENILRRESKKCNWFGPIHGGKFRNLLRESAVEMSRLDFAIFALGGLVKIFLDYRFKFTLEMLINVKECIIPSKPLHMFGLGLPQFFSLAIACGCDLMDSAAYILFAKENRYFTLSTGTKNLNELVEFPCNCPICSNYSPTELKKMDKNLRTELLAKHNLYLSFSELRTIRQAIREGNLWELVELRVRNHPNLVKALEIVKEKGSFFEIYEKLYKNHGRLFSSKESLDRPLIFRYQQRIYSNYRVPKEAQYLLILPELDVKGKNSPSITKWLEEVKENQILNHQEIHIAFISYFFGIIPIELINTFPMGQYESYGFEYSLCSGFLNKFRLFFKKHGDKYRKCAILIPEYYIDQFHHQKSFKDNNALNSLKSLLKRQYNSNFGFFKDIDSILIFFKGDNKTR
jgi:7-cyano-7-deazaguanine tRNA-ribosyltransferase